MLSCWPSSQMHSAGCHLRLDRTYSFLSSDCRLHDGRWHIGTSVVRHVAAFQRAGPPLVLGLPGADHSATADTPRSPRPLETEIEYVTQASSNDFASVFNADQGSPTLTVQ